MKTIRSVVMTFPESRRRPLAQKISAALLMLVFTGIAGCGEPPTLDAPVVNWGQDVCVDCGMILSDERYAAAVVTIEQGERQVHLFDDVGEMVTSRRKFADPSKRWVRDAQARQWIDAESAFYVRSTQLHTPMGFGVAAFADAAHAQAKRDEVDGEQLRAGDFIQP